MDTRLKEIALYYGFDAQINQLQEEMAELSKEICKYRRSQGVGMPVRNNRNTERIIANIIEEAADVSICMEEVIYLMNAEDLLQDVCNYKTDRTYKIMTGIDGGAEYEK